MVMQGVYQNIFMEALPLPNNPLKSLNLFIIKGDKRSMIIDCGFNTEETREIMLNIFEKHGLDFENTILYLTHRHSDHVGLATFLRDKGLEVSSATPETVSRPSTICRSAVVEWAACCHKQNTSQPGWQGGQSLGHARRQIRLPPGVALRKL
jgi:glyoxylase-like metal-dependent hydrolase (beta-lactamase superfamily II)